MERQERLACIPGALEVIVIRKIVAVGALSLSLAGCKHAAPESLAAAPAPEADVEGRIIVRGILNGPSVSFSADQVVGPRINLGRQSDGSWGGMLRDRMVTLTVEPGTVSSPTLTLHIQNIAQGVEVRGTWITPGPRDDVEIRVSPDELYLREPYVEPAVYLEAIGEGHYGSGIYGDAVELVGAAARLHPPEPQFALGLLGAF
jgi:hypothetical protein